MKKIVIFSYSEYAAKVHEKTLKDIFGDQLKVEIWLASDHTKKMIQADLAIIVSGNLMGYAKQYLAKNTPIISATYTLERMTVEKIKNITQSSKVSLVSYTRYQILQSRKALLMDMGIEKQQLEICGNVSCEKNLNSHVIYFGREVPDHLKKYHVIHIPSRLLSVGMIMEIGVFLGIDFTMCNKAIQEYCKHVTVLHGAGDYETISYDAAYSIFSGHWNAVIMFNNSYEVYYCNEAAERLLGLQIKQYIDKKIGQILPFLKGYTQEQINTFGEQVIDFNGSLRVVRIEMSNMHNAPIGVVCIFNYWTMQKHHDNLERQLHRKHHKAKYTFYQLIGNSSKMAKCKEIARRMADSDENILIQGESGVGKELFAQAIHNASSRKDYPFVALNCGAMVDTLMESELFGYEEGAFTGAKKGGKQGYFEAANNGTLFLDEIGEMPLHMQTRLLRVLQEHEIVRVGGNDAIPINVRVIAATHQDLKQMTKDKTFRTDLYYRLCVLPLHIPSLNERREDIPLLIEYFKQKKNYTFQISDSALCFMKNYNYEGNIRELENCLSYLSNLQKGVIEVEDLPEYMQDIQLDCMLSQNPVTSFCGNGKDMVLKAIFDINHEKGTGAGRRSVREYLIQKKYPMGETEIRKIMNVLEQEGMIAVSAGRGGSRVTEEGYRKIESNKTVQ